MGRRKEKWETDKKQWEEEKRNILAPFFNNPSSDYPSIPASSLRGMLRTLVEIVSFSKIDKVADQKLVYRAFADVTSLGDFYRDRLMQSQDEDSKQYSFLMQAGYIVQDQGVWKIQPAQEISQGTSFARIEKSQISKILKKPWHGIKHAKKVDIWIDSLAWHPHRGGFIELYYAKVNPSSSGKKSSGVLVETQGLANKKMEYVFGLPDDSAKPILIPDSKENPMLQNYEEQMTKEQKEFLGKEGVLRNMHPVFYLIENDELVFFGHTMMFRLPYGNSVRDFIPDCISTANNPDLVESIFGFVRDSKHIDMEQSLSCRVFFTDAVTTDNDIWLAGNSTESITPHILGSPKPTTFQHYLVQSKEEELKHYEDELDKSAIRGHKLYWHKKDVKRNEIEQTDKNEIKKVRSQYTDIKPVKEGVEFKFDIYFENLSDVELGSLLWINDISQDEKYRLSLGMGKPLGMGAIKITHELYLSIAM
jgi:CRISPR-associated protein (TIGR03986 family)